MHNNVRVHLFVSGYVQGVFFRHKTYKKAVSLNLKGFVKNLSDGRVEVVAEGKKEDANKLIDFCKKGPLFGKVKDLIVNYEKVSNKFKEFRVEY